MSHDLTTGPTARTISRSARAIALGILLCGAGSLQAGAAPTTVVTSTTKTLVSSRALFHHTSVWAAQWAAAHPAAEARYEVNFLRANGVRNPEAVMSVAAVHVKHTAVIVAAAKAPVRVKPVAKPATQAAVPTAPQPASLAQSAPIVLSSAVASTKLASNNTAATAGPAAPSATPELTSPATTTSFSGSAQQTRAAGADETTTGNVTLDFVAADINDVLKALSFQTHTNIVSGADVKGTITVSLSHVTLDEALSMITRLSGFQYAKVGSTYVVGTAAGILSLTGNPSENTDVTAVVTYNYATYADLSSLLTDRFPDLKISDGSASDKGKDNGEYKAIVLFGDPSFVAQARDMITQIDTSLGANVSNQATVVYKVKYASLNDLVTILGQLVPSLNVTPGPGQGFTAKAPGASAGSTGGGSSSSSGSGSSSGGSSSGSSSGGSGSSSSGGSGSGGSASGPGGPDLLLLTGAQGDIDRAQQLLAQIDVQPAQIEYDTKVTEIDINKVNDLGLNWDFSGATTTIGEEPTGTSTSSTTTTATLGNNNQKNLLSFGAIGRTAVTNLATVTLDALLTTGDAKLLSDPNISAVDGHQAQVFIGDTINYVESITQTTTGENVTTATVQVGVILRVTGKVGPDGYITLNIHPEVSEITGYLTVPGGGSLPQIANRFADTTVRVKNGETIAIGGLIQDNDTKSTNKVPGLGDLPFVGKLFQDNQDTKSRTEVVFLLTTKVANQ